MFPKPKPSLTPNTYAYESEPLVKPTGFREYDARWLRADYRAGDVVVHCSQIVHAALDNVDQDRVVRLSTDIRYQRTTEPIDARWQHHWSDTDGL